MLLVSSIDLICWYLALNLTRPQAQDNTNEK